MPRTLLFHIEEIFHEPNPVGTKTNVSPDAIGTPFTLHIVLPNAMCLWKINVSNAKLSWQRFIMLCGNWTWIVSALICLLKAKRLISSAKLIKFFSWL